MKKSLYYLLILFSLSSTIALSGQSLEDFPWLGEMIDPEYCCEVQTATALWNSGNYYVFIESSDVCGQGNGKLFSEQGDCWCEDFGDFNCLDYYNFNNSTEIYSCTGENNELNLFSEYSWLSSMVDQANCCADENIIAYSINGYSFVYIQSDPSCSDNPGMLFFETGQLWCTDFGGFSCLNFYGLNEDTNFASWSCDGSGCEETLWYQDADGDGFGNPNASVLACTQPTGYVNNASDSDDSCNGTIDECGVCNGNGQSTWYQDADGDGLGNPNASILACTQPTGYVSNASDSDDSCNGTIDECGICNGGGASDWCQDLDGDGLGNANVSISACTQPDGYVADCSDTDDSCNGTIDECGICNGGGASDWCQDLDGDGLGNANVSISACTQPDGYVADCSDTDDSCNGTVDECGVCYGSGEAIWCQDMDSDGLGNPAIFVSSCDQPTGYVSDCTDDDDSGTTTDCLINGIHAAYAEFDEGSFTIYMSGNEIVMETDGLPNHTSPYWSNTTERCLSGPMGTMCTNSNTTEDHPLFVEPTETSFDQMAPGNIDDFNGSYSLTIPVAPQLAASPSSTGLGAIGFAVSGSMIYNDEEGPNVPLDNAVGSLDYTAAHTGPQSYHYHLETKAWSEDDDALIGIISDGFFIYGRKCNSTGDYPTDLDESGGHTSMTQHSCEPEYHYHIQNEVYLNEYYILFPGDYQGTPNNIQ